MGPPVPLTAALSEELRQSLPPILVEALQRIGEQIEAEIIDPLLGAGSIEQLAATFEQSFPKFRDYYISTILIMLGSFQKDPQRFSTLTIRAFQKSEGLIRDHGFRWIGPEATLTAFSGLATIVRIAKAAKRLFEDQSSLDLHGNEPVLEQWANSIAAYALAYSSILSCLTRLAKEQAIRCRLENVATLAQWSKIYAVQAYHFTRAIGFFNGAVSPAPIAATEPEDLILAEIGLDSYDEGLQQDDQP